MRRIFTATLLLSVSVSGLTCVEAGQVQPPAASAALLEKLQEREALAKSLPDTAGDGAYPAIKEELPSLPDHVVYRPASLAPFGARKLPIIVWGNGGCSSDGASQRFHLSEIASHGYLVIALGRIKSGPGISVQPRRPRPPGPMVLSPAETKASGLTDAIDWAIAENKRPGSPFFGKIDPTAVAVAGYSCGGAQALRVARDPRVKAVLIQNSGLFNQPTGMAEMDVGKETLETLHTPIIYILGGPSDIAYENGMDDYEKISKVPVIVANLGNVGHGGSYLEPNGGAAAKAAMAWLDWQLKGDAAARSWFIGPDCRLCRDPQWSLKSKGFGG